MTLKRRVLALAVVSVFVTVGSGAYLFRHQQVDHPDLGKVTLKWRWGSAAEMAVDCNSDGLVDSRILYYRWATDFRTHEPFDEAWESSQCDGRFDRHSSLVNGQWILEYDSDGDRVLDRRLEGPEAEKYLQEHPRPRGCKWGPQLPAALPGRLE